MSKKKPAPPRRNTPHDPEKYDEAKRRIMAGELPSKIAADLGVNRATVNGWKHALKKEGVKVPEIGRGRRRPAPAPAKPKHEGFTLREDPPTARLGLFRRLRAIGAETLIPEQKIARVALLLGVEALERNRAGALQHAAALLKGEG